MPVTRSKQRWLAFALGLTLTALALCSCQFTQPLYQQGARPAQEPALPEGTYSRCLREILLLGQADIPMSDLCWRLSHFTPTSSPSPTSEKPKP